MSPSWCGVFLTIGGAEDATRRAGALAAARMLDSLQIPNRYREIPGAGHARAPAYKTPLKRSASCAIQSPPIHSSEGFSQSGASCT